MKFLSSNLVADTNTVLTASSSDPSFPVSNLKHPFRSKRWRSTGCTSETILFDFRTTEPVDSVVIMWPKETGVRLTAGATITVQANATNVWTSPAVSETLTVNNTYEIASKYFSTDKNYRYWRIIITDPTNPDGFVELGMVWIGKSLALQDSENGFKYNLIDRSKSVRTDYGHKYTDKYPKTAVLGISFKYMDYSETQVLENAFRTNGSDVPVLFIMDPTGTVFDKDHFVLYGTMDANLGLTHVFYNIISGEGLVIEESL